MSARHSIGSPRRIAAIAGVAVAYVIAGKLGLLLASEQANATAVWAPAGISLAAFLLLGHGVWPAILLGALLVNVTTAGNVATSAAIGIGNTLEGLVAASLVRRFAGGVRCFDRPQDVLKFAAFAGVIGSALSATIGVTSLSLAGFSAWERYVPVWSTWWLGDLGGMVIVAPLLILWGRGEPARWNRARTLEAGGLALLVVVAGGAVFGALLPLEARKYALAFMSLPPLLWAAFRFEPRETASAGVLLALIALWGTLRGFGPFVRDDPGESLLLLQSFMSATCLMALLFAAVVSESRRLAAAPLRQDLAHIGRVSALGELAGSLAHELSQPLAAIRSNARAALRLLARGEPNLDEVVRILGDIVADDERASGVIRRLRALFGKGELERLPLDVNEAVNEVARLVRSDVARRNVALGLELARPLPQVHGDRMQIQQVVLNLVLNGLDAIAASPGGERRLVIRSAADGAGGVAVEVEDSGAGIEPEHEEKIFEPLYTTKHGGLGMGLAIARVIVEAHGGHLLGRNNPHGGATFCFSLPTLRGAAR